MHTHMSVFVFISNKYKYRAILKDSKDIEQCKSITFETILRFHMNVNLNHLKDGYTS